MLFVKQFYERLWRLKVSFINLFEENKTKILKDNQAKYGI